MKPSNLTLLTKEWNQKDSSYTETKNSEHKLFSSSFPVTNHIWLCPD